jgi:hypothetical protein
MTAKQKLPDGIETSHMEPIGWHRFANPIAVIGIAMFLGLFGGQPHPTRVIETSSATITMEFPQTLRNGEFFEMRATVKAKRAFADVKLGISSSYWHDMTVNTMLPAPAEETSKDGRYIFSYGALKPGDILKLKFDGQINPPMFAGTDGNLTIFDGDAELATIPIKLRVFP